MINNTPLYISWRYQSKKQKGGLVTLISYFSTLGIALGVAVLIIGLSTMNGFERELNNRILAVVPHVKIIAYGEQGQARPINDYTKLLSSLSKNPEVKGVSGYASFTALIENGTKIKSVNVKGINKDQQDKTSQLGKFVIGDDWESFGKNEGMILGYGLAKELDVKKGDWITLLIPQTNQDNSQISQPDRQRIQIAGILRLDGQLDYSYALLPLSQAHHYLNLNSDEITGVELSLKNPFKAEMLSYANLENYPQNLFASTWIREYGFMYRDIHLIRLIMYIAMVLVISIACFNVVSTLVMAVKDKQGDIAIMRTLGANDSFIKRIFIYYGLLNGMKGCLIGVIVGIFATQSLTTIIQGIEHLIGRKILSDGIYFVDFLPTELHWLDVFLVLVVTVILSLLASLYPANRAKKLAPAQVLSNY